MYDNILKNRTHILKFLKLSLISGVVFVFLLIAVTGLLAYIYRDNIKEHFIAEINKGLQTEVFIEDISINVLRNFPMASITLNNVVMLEAIAGKDKDTLLQAGRVHFRFSVTDFIRQNYIIRQAVISNGFLSMKKFDDNTNNYTFWKKQEATEPEQEDMEFNLQQVVFEKIDFSYQDFAQKHTISFSIGNTALKGNFSRNNYALMMRGDMKVIELIIDDALMFRNQPMKFDFEADVTENNLYHFSRGTFTLGEHSFTGEGSIDLSGEHDYIDIRIDATNLRLDRLIGDLPPQYSRFFEGYRSKGELVLNASVKGHFNGPVNPYVKADFGIANAELYHRKANLKFTGLSFSGSFNNGNRRNLSSTAIQINELRAQLNNGIIEADASIVNFVEPEVDLKLFSTIDANEWNRFLQNEYITDARGELLVDISFSGRLDESKKFNKHHFMASRVHGKIEAVGAELRLKQNALHYHDIHADLTFNNNDIIINHFSGRASDSDFDMEGYFRNVLPWLFLDDQRLLVDARLSSNVINFNQLLTHETSESDTTYRLILSDKIDFRLRADVDSMIFRKFHGRNINGELSMRDQVFYADNISLNTMKGNIIASGYINGKSDENLIIGCQASIYDVDVHDLFYQLGNFGQQGIGYENLRGTITANASFVSHWSPFLDIDWSTLETTADIKVENGELINYKPMLALSRFIRVGDLNEVKFSTLENQIQIKNQNIIIPDMEINSNAINIRLSGEHSFNNDINYRLQVLLSDLLARRNRESRNPQEQYGDIIDDGLGRTTLFLLVTGTIDEPVFRYDTRGVREKLREDFREEGQNLRNVLRTEFGMQRNDTLPDGTPADPTPRQEEQKEIEKGEEGKFIIEWDD